MNTLVLTLSPTDQVDFGFEGFALNQSKIDSVLHVRSASRTTLSGGRVFSEKLLPSDSFKTVISK